MTIYDPPIFMHSDGRLSFLLRNLTKGLNVESKATILVRDNTGYYKDRRWYFQYIGEDTWQDKCNFMNYSNTYKFFDGLTMHDLMQKCLATIATNKILE